jgi:hypothetical protein
MSRLLTRWFAVLLGFLTISEPVSSQNAADGLLYFTVKNLWSARNYDDALRTLEPEVAKGNLFAEYLFGATYEHKGQEEDLETAVRWFRRSAEAGFADSQVALGDMLRWGKGVEHSPHEAAKWYREAIKHNARRGRSGLAILIASNEVSEPEGLPKAVQLFREAAKPYDADSVSRLNGMVLNHAGRDRDNVDSDMLPALCYLAELQAATFAGSDKGFVTGQAVALRWLSPPGCKTTWVWTQGGAKQMVAILTSIAESDRTGLKKKGFVSLPKQLEILFAGEDQSCPVAKANSAPVLMQSGPDITISNLAGSTVSGSASRNHIVISTSITLTDQYRTKDAYTTVVSGNWNGHEALLTNTFGNCTIKLKAVGGN